MKIVKISKNYNYVEFDNGYILEAYHAQDCCENVYAEFDMLAKYNVSVVTGKQIDIRNIEFPETLSKMIQKIKNCGFLMKNEGGEKFLVPCHNEQNGYYSTQLILQLYDKNKFLLEELDIEECCVDEIY